jgi:hypothetical protein
MSWGKIGLFLGGTLFGSAGIRILSSRDAKKVYTHCTAAVLRVKDAAIDQVAVLQENCADIYAEAKAINEARYEKASGETIILDDDAEAEDVEETAMGAEAITE